MEHDKKKQVEVSKQSTSQTTNSIYSSTAIPCTNLNQKIADLLYDSQTRFDLEPYIDRPQIKSLLMEKQKESPTLLGILGKCKIHGCDVHLISPSLEILNHIKLGVPLESQYQKAREILNAKESPVIGILIYEDRLELICIDGSIQRVL